MRNADGEVGTRFCENLRCPPFVRPINIGKQVDDRDGLDIFVFQDFGSCTNCRFVERDQLFAISRHPFRDFQSPMPRYQNGGSLVKKVIHPLEVATADFQNVAEAIRCQQCGFCAFSFDYGIDTDGGAVYDETRLRQVHARQFEAAQDRRRQLIRRRECFRARNLACLLIQENEIRESSADIDADTYWQVFSKALDFRLRLTEFIANWSAFVKKEKLGHMSGT